VKYPLAIAEKMLNTFGKDLGGGFYIGCRFGTTLANSPLGPLLMSSITPPYLAHSTVMPTNASVSYLTLQHTSKAWVLKTWKDASAHLPN